MRRGLTGLYPAVATPFKNKGDKIDIDAFERHINWLLENDVDGIVISGSTGEAPHLNREERRLLTEVGRDAVGDKILIVGTGGQTLPETLIYSNDAIDLGADILLVITPYYYRVGSEELEKYYRSVSEKLDGDILLYNFPQVTGVNIEVRTVEKLVRINNIVGIKDSSGDMPRIVKLVKAVNKEGYVLNGNAFLSLPSLVIGGHGLILAAANIAPKPIKVMMELVREGEYLSANKLYWELYDVFIYLETTGIPGIKKVLSKLIGYPVECRPPIYRSVDEIYAERIAELCKKLNKEY